MVSHKIANRKKKCMVRRSVLDKIFREMINIRYRLDDIEKNVSNWNPQPLEVSSNELLQLPDHLRQTYLTVTSRGESNATVISDVTGRSRAIESDYLNQLTRLGWLNKRRVSRTIYFRPASELGPLQTAKRKSESDLDG
jgi:hypothetical protein